MIMAPINTAMNKNHHAPVMSGDPLQSGEIGLLLEILEALLQGDGLGLRAPVPNKGDNDNEEVDAGD